MRIIVEKYSFKLLGSSKDNILLYLNEPMTGSQK